MDGKAGGQCLSRHRLQLGLPRHSVGWEVVQGRQEKLIADLIVAQVDQAPTATVESMDDMGGPVTAITASGEMSGGETKAEVDVVAPFLMGEGSACVRVGEGREPGPCVFAALQATLLRHREGGRVRN